MIQVNFEKKSGHYQSIEVKGHAESAAYGKDLICAAVSSIMFGFMNAIDLTKEACEISQEENRILVLNHSKDDKINHYFELVMIQLKTIEESYHQYIHIEGKEQS